ncbi:MAG: mitochondrial fission ELM1 family protein [Kiritimatiellae bacterium]|nr:mitochondrial fission ELM1 family protein [Kiritimatiellia bacterium]
MKGEVLILTDGKAGHENQSRAFARALGCEPLVLPVRFKSPFAKMLSYLLDLFGILSLSIFKDLQVPHDVKNLKAIIGTGSGTFYAVKALARRLGVPCGVVLYPRGYRLAGFDCILAPSFDRPDNVPNVIPIPANLVAADAAFYEAGVKAFRERYSPSDRPAVAVIVGGPNKCSTLSADWMRARLEEIFAAYKPTSNVPQATNHEIWVTTSRRTPPDVEAVVDSFPFDYKLLYSHDHFNPIPAFVSLARVLYVTAESTGMLSEACTFGTAEVHALDNLKSGPHKFRRFIDDLAAAGHLGGARKIDLSAQFARARKLLKI